MTVAQKEEKDKIVRRSRKHSICGVPGRVSRIIKRGDHIWQQQWESEPRLLGGGKPLKAIINLSGVDEVGARFWVRTSGVGWRGGGADEDLVATFPELVHLMRWRGFLTKGPRDYPRRPLDLAGDLSPNGHRKGDLHYSAVLVMHVRGIPLASEQYAQAGRPDLGEERNPDAPRDWFPVDMVDPFVDQHDYERKAMQAVIGVSEGSERYLDTAREEAFWPDATDEQLMLPREELKKLLMDRLPGLIAEFQAEMDSIGFIYE